MTPIEYVKHSTGQKKIAFATLLRAARSEACFISFVRSLPLSLFMSFLLFPSFPHCECSAEQNSAAIASTVGWKKFKMKEEIPVLSFFFLSILLCLMSIEYGIHEHHKSDRLYCISPLFCLDQLHVAYMAMYG